MLSALTKSDAIAAVLIAIQLVHFWKQETASHLGQTSSYSPFHVAEKSVREGKYRTWSPPRQSAKAGDGGSCGDTMERVCAEPCSTDNDTAACPDNSEQDLAEAERDGRETQAKGFKTKSEWPESNQRPIDFQEY